MSEVPFSFWTQIQLRFWTQIASRRVTPACHNFWVQS